MGWFFKSRSEREQDERKRQEEQKMLAARPLKYQAFVEQYKQRYQEIKREAGLPTSNFESITVFGKNLFIWRDSEYFYMLEHPMFLPAQVDSFISHHPQTVLPNQDIDFSVLGDPLPKYFKFEIESIKKFYSSGSVNTINKLTGGEKRFNLPEAIVGGMIAGPLGALIAGQEATPYSLQTITTDTRKTFLRIQDVTYELPANDIKALRKIIPEKEV